MAEAAHLLMVTKKSVFANLKKEAKSANKKSKQWKKQLKHAKGYRKKSKMEIIQLFW